MSEVRWSTDNAILVDPDLKPNNMNIKVKVNGTVYTVQSQPLSASDWVAYNG